jgi:hypothetical protein
LTAAGQVTAQSRHHPFGKEIYDFAERMPHFRIKPPLNPQPGGRPGRQPFPRR